MSTKRDALAAIICHVQAALDWTEELPDDLDSIVSDLEEVRDTAVRLIDGGSDA